MKPLHNQPGLKQPGLKQDDATPHDKYPPSYPGDDYWDDPADYAWEDIIDDSSLDALEPRETNVPCDNGLLTFH